MSGGDATVEIQGLNIALADGDYWIGFAPIAPFGTYGQIYYYPTAAPWGDPSALRNPGGGFGFGTAWGTAAGMLGSPNDFTLVIEGTAAPEPATWALVGLSLLALGGAAGGRINLHARQAVPAVDPPPRIQRPVRVQAKRGSFASVGPRRPGRAPAARPRPITTPPPAPPGASRPARSARA